MVQFIIFIIASDKDWKKFIKGSPLTPISPIASPKIKLKATNPKTFVPAILIWFISHSSIGTKK